MQIIDNVHPYLDKHADFLSAAFLRLNFDFFNNWGMIEVRASKPVTYVAIG